MQTCRAVSNITVPNSFAANQRPFGLRREYTSKFSFVGIFADPSSPTVLRRIRIAATVYCGIWGIVGWWLGRANVRGQGQKQGCVSYLPRISSLHPFTRDMGYSGWWLGRVKFRSQGQKQGCVSYVWRIRAAATVYCGRLRRQDKTGLGGCRPLDVVGLWRLEGQE